LVTRQVLAQAVVAQGEALLRAIGPGPFAGRVVEGQHGLVSLGRHHAPGPAPGLAVQGVRMIAQVRRQGHLMAAEAEPAVADAVAERNQGEVAGVEHLARPGRRRPAARRGRPR
jgi:hypothetical protein